MSLWLFSLPASDRHHETSASEAWTAAAAMERNRHLPTFDGDACRVGTS